MYEVSPSISSGKRRETTMYIIREKMFRLAEDSDITDETGQIVLHVDGNVMSLHSRLILRVTGR
jgi:uncharacterized protein YxjI